MATSVPVAMTIAGSDPSGGAGLQADLKTFHQFGVFGLAVPTLITVQDTRGVRELHPLEPDLVRAQLSCVGEDIPPSAAKSGALGQADTVIAVAEWARDSGTTLVVDPVMLSTHGQTLASEAAVEAMIEHLLPICHLVTPNLREAAVLAGIDVSRVNEMRKAAKRIGGLGARNVLVKGGHLRGDAVDVLWTGGEFRDYVSQRIETASTHGTGCTYSAAITALLARGRALNDAVEDAKRYVTEAIRTAPGLGRGSGPLNHHVISAAESD